MSEQEVFNKGDKMQGFDKEFQESIIRLKNFYEKDVEHSNKRIKIFEKPNKIDNVEYKNAMIKAIKEDREINLIRLKQLENIFTFTKNGDVEQVTPNENWLKTIIRVYEFNENTGYFEVEE